MNYTSRDANNFNLIRMIAAYMVIFAHAAAIQGRGVDIVAKITGQTHSGQMAVFIFTFLSGIFITKSVINSDVKSFIKKRIVRLYPELIICLIVILLLGSIFTTYSQYDYWTNPQTGKYFFANLFEIANEHILPGVFENHPNSSMNGVLWYITFEIRVYLLWALLKSFSVFKDKTKTNIVLVILLSWVISKPNLMPFLGSDVNLYGSMDFPQYTITFIIGALVYVNAKEVCINYGHIILSILLMYVFRHSSIATWVWAFGFVVISLWIGTNKRVLKIKIKDLSYGIFLYGWPVGQLINEFFPSAQAYIAAFLTAVVSTIVAFASEKLADKTIILVSRISNKYVKKIGKNT